MAGEERRYKIAEVTAASRDGWRAFANRHGVTPTALAEVLGLRMSDLAAISEADLPQLLSDCVQDARQLAYDRRRRDPD